MTSFLDGSAESEMRLMDLTKTLEVSILITSVETGVENSGEYRTTVAPALLSFCLKRPILAVALSKSTAGNWQLTTEKKSGSMN